MFFNLPLNWSESLFRLIQSVTKQPISDPSVAIAA
jgi:hypothetical protein